MLFFFPGRRRHTRFDCDWSSDVCSSDLMTLACAIFLPLTIWPIGKLGRRIRHSVETSQTRLGELTQILQETVGGNRIVKAFGMEDFEIGNFQAASKRLLRETMRWVRAQVATSPLMDL